MKTITIVTIIILALFLLAGRNTEPVLCNPGESVSAGTMARLVAVCMQDGMKVPGFQQVEGQCQIVCVEKGESNLL